MTSSQQSSSLLIIFLYMDLYKETNRYTLATVAWWQSFCDVRINRRQQWWKFDKVILYFHIYRQHLGSEWQMLVNAMLELLNVDHEHNIVDIIQKRKYLLCVLGKNSVTLQYTYNMNWPHHQMNQTVLIKWAGREYDPFIIAVPWYILFCNFLITRTLIYIYMHILIKPSIKNGWIKHLKYASALISQVK